MGRARRALSPRPAVRARRGMHVEWAPRIPPASLRPSVPPLRQGLPDRVFPTGSSLRAFGFLAGPPPVTCGRIAGVSLPGCRGERRNFREEPGRGRWSSPFAQRGWSLIIKSCGSLSVYSIFSFSCQGNSSVICEIILCQFRCCFFFSCTLPNTVQLVD